MKKDSAQPLIIKKYENRRLYNTLTSQYINQDQVAQLVRDGYDVRVIDAATGEDMTRLILAQIVVEDAKTPGSVFPLDVLRHMILASGRATQENALRYMKAMMDMYQNAYRALPPPMNPFEFVQGQWPPAANRVGAEPESQMGVSATQMTVNEADKLRRRVEELESLLTKHAPKKAAKKRKIRRKS
jgi:polyhydroxyalkanoate synthesis repressor PhaR